jgi:uncharacterized protein
MNTIRACSCAGVSLAAVQYAQPPRASSASARRGTSRRAIGLETLPRRAGGRRRPGDRLAGVEPDAVEIRILGCLIEKQRTTPDAYPLSLNALRLACNQSTNRNPVVDYDEHAIKEALQRTYRRGWTRLASGHGSRAAKYRHLLDEALGLAPDELALLGVLMLRGAQTPGELKQRAERLHRFEDLAAVEATLSRLIERGHVAQLPRQPGQKEERYVQLLGGEAEVGAGAPAATAAPPATAPPAAAPPATAPPAAARPETAPPATAPAFAPVDPQAAPATPPAAGALPPVAEQRIARLEREVGQLREALAALRADLGA